MATKAISARIEVSILEALEAEQYVSGVNRNMMLNRAAKDYIELLDAIRKCRAMGCSPIESASVRGWLSMVEDKMTIRWYI